MCMRTRLIVFLHISNSRISEQFLRFWQKQWRNEVRWRLGQETSLTPHVRTCSLSETNVLLKKVLVTLLGLFGCPRSGSAPP